MLLAVMVQTDTLSSIDSSILVLRGGSGIQGWEDIQRWEEIQGWEDS